jgi:hypothetical protein
MGIAALSASGPIPTSMQFCDSSPVQSEGIAAQFFPCSPWRHKNAHPSSHAYLNPHILRSFDEPVSLLVVCIHAAPPSSFLRTLVARRGISAPLDIFQSIFLPIRHGYAAFGSCGLVVPATSPFLSPSTSTAGNCPCGFLTCARTASVTDFGACVGKRTALRAFSVCSPEGRYLGSRRPIWALLR